MDRKSTNHKQTSGKNTSKSRTRTSTRKKNNKVYIAPYKAVLLCTVVIFLCLGLLLLNNDVSSKLKKAESSEKKTNRTEQTVEKETVTSPQKEETKKTEQNKSSSKPNLQPKKEQVVKTPAPENKTQNNQPAEKKPEETEQTVTSPQKKTTEQTETSKKTFGFPVAKNNAQLIFVFDDGGQNLEHLNKFMSLPFPFTVAVLPQLTHSAESAEKVRKSGNEVILHQPMQAVNKNVNPGPGAITPEMNEDQIISALFANVSEIGPIAGINNHEGSAITADVQKIETILKFVSENSLYFLDSRTNVETKVPYVAQALGFSWYERNIFLDNTKTKENALTELKKGLGIANKNGSVIMIGHIWSADFLPAFLKEVYPELKEKGYTFSVVSKSKAQKY